MRVRVVRVKSNGSAKYVELSVECFWTRVRFPPSPPINKNATHAVAFLFTVSLEKALARNVVRAPDKQVLDLSPMFEPPALEKGFSRVNLWRLQSNLGFAGDLDNLAWYQCIFIERVDRTQAMIAVGDDDFHALTSH